ncbi:MAG: hypothetical protein KI790_11255 [Cyclobacteriaceae bacterium]|nr:hypothetical protein [Cyclobacteriaceae bacterium HetDA_MAG_MS6]
MRSQSKLLEIAQAVNWFESPIHVLENQNKFLCYAMKYGLMEDIIDLLDHYGKEAFRKAMGSIYVKILDDRSRAYFELITKEVSD